MYEEKLCLDLCRMFRSDCKKFIIILMQLYRTIIFIFEKKKKKITVISMIQLK